MNKTIEKDLHSTYNLIPQKITEGWEKLNKLNKKYGLETLVTKKERQTYNHFIKAIDQGHSH